jgi:hypothetical protein
MEKAEKLKHLFEKISDSYEDIVEQTHISEDYVELKFFRHGVEMENVQLSLRYLMDGDERLEMIGVDHNGGEKILVSNEISAIIAVCTR